MNKITDKSILKREALNVLEENGSKSAKELKRLKKLKNNNQQK